LQDKQFRHWEVRSLDDPWSYAASRSLKHFINRCTWKSSQYYIVKAWLRRSCVCLKSLCFIKVNVFAPSSVYSLLQQCMYPRLPSCICVCHVTAMHAFKFKLLACGMEDVSQYNIQLCKRNDRTTNKLSIFCRLQTSVTMPYLSFRGRCELSTGWHLQQKDQNHEAISYCCLTRSQSGAKGTVIPPILVCKYSNFEQKLLWSRKINYSIHQFADI